MASARSASLPPAWSDDMRIVKISKEKTAAVAAAGAKRDCNKT